MMAHFCLDCGTRLEHRLIEDREREICPKCGWVYYQQRKVSAGVRIEKDGCLLLVQRGIEPWFERWYMPAGFVEVDEEPDQAAIREAYEETGLVVKILDLAGTYTYSDDPRGNGLVLLYNAEITGGELKVTPETLQAGFFSAGEIEKMQFAGASADRQVSDWINDNSQGKGKTA
jgi:ADP-ribose pyrophosphatase YjhB (NUDIX family)